MLGFKNGWRSTSPPSSPCSRSLERTYGNLTRYVQLVSVEGDDGFVSSKVQAVSFPHNKMEDSQYYLLWRCDGTDGGSGEVKRNFNIPFSVNLVGVTHLLPKTDIGWLFLTPPKPHPSLVGHAQMLCKANTVFREPPKKHQQLNSQECS